MFNTNLVSRTLANQPLNLSINALKSANVTRAWQNTASTSTGTSGTTAITTSSALGNGAIVGMQIRLAGSDIYTIAAISGTSITTVETLTTNYSASVTAVSLTSSIAGYYLTTTSVSQSTNSVRPMYVLKGMNNQPALLFDSSGKSIIAATSSLVDGMFSAGGTMFFVAKPRTDGEGNAGRLVDKTAYSLACYTGSDLKFTQAMTSGSYSWRTSGAKFPANTINVVCITYDSSSPSTEPNIYINSLTRQTLTNDTTGTGSASSGSGIDMVIGSNSGLTNTFDGLIGWVSAHKRVLSATEIAYNMKKLALIFGGTIS